MRAELTPRGIVFRASSPEDTENQPLVEKMALSYPTPDGVAVQTATSGRCLVTRIAPNPVGPYWLFMYDLLKAQLPGCITAVAYAEDPKNIPALAYAVPF